MWSDYSWQNCHAKVPRLRSRTLEERELKHVHPATECSSLCALFEQLPYNSLPGGLYLIAVCIKSHAWKQAQ